MLKIKSGTRINEKQKKLNLRNKALLLSSEHDFPGWFMLISLTLVKLVGQNKLD